MIPRPSKITIKTYYDKLDKDFSEDYIGIDVLLDKKVIYSYGDDYHDKGQIKAEAFLAGVLSVFQETIEVEWIDVNLK